VVVVTALDTGPQVTAPNAGDDDRDERSTRHRGPAWRWPAAALAVAVAVGAAGLGVARLAGGDPPPPAMGPGDVTVQLDVDHSLFTPTELRVVEGTRVRFVVVNGDPIAHELIVGPPDVHARHAEGTEAEHPSIPGEVSVGAGLTAVTTRWSRPESLR
jgi:plastocyanin